MQDLWMLLAGDESEQRLQLDALLSGYEEFTAFDHRQLALIEPLRTARMISHLGWLSLRWGDPAFPAAFPWFATENFWVEQYRVLGEQRERLKAPPISLTSYR
ncbi:MAG: stress response kinase A, partial [Aeromonadaceae bacterium]